MPKSNFQDVQDFHDKFGLERPKIATVPPEDVLDFRLRFMQEELDEFKLSMFRFYTQMNVSDAVQGTNGPALTKDALIHMGDALIDLVYVAMGTADLMGIPWEPMWDEVQRANMSKQRAQSAEQSKQSTGRGHAFDVIKPPGWTPPNHAPIIDAVMQDDE